MNDATRRLDEALCRLPFDAVALRQLLETERYSPQELQEAAVRFIQDAILTQDAALNGDDAPAGTLHCAALPEALQLLLAHGLKANDTFWIEGQPMVSRSGLDCLLNLVRPIEWGDVAARCVRLLLEHGASAFLHVGGRGDPFGNLWGLIDEAVCDYNAQPDTYVQQLMVMLGFEPTDALNMAPGVPPERLKQFETIRWEPVITPPADDWDAPWMTLRFIDRETGELLGEY